jgi:protein phosphatase 1 regulatory subunit 10
MAKSRKESPAVSTPPAATSGTPPTTASLTKSGKKRKTVTWASEGQLESIRLIERAIYDDDPVDVSLPSLSVEFSVQYINFVRLAFTTQGIHTSHNLRDLDRDEGAALHAHLFEEAVDWSEPLCKPT